MSDSSVVHAKFVIERKFPQSPERVFNAKNDDGEEAEPGNDKRRR